MGRDMFTRGAPEGIETVTSSQWDASLFDLLTSYARQRQKHALSHVTVKQRVVWSLAEARDALQKLTGFAAEWTILDDYLLQYCVTPELRRTVRASAFSASLELVREGVISIRQDRDVYKRQQLRFVNDEKRELTCARLAMVVSLTSVLASGLSLIHI